MEGAARRQGTAQPRRQLDGEGRHDGDSTSMTMDDEELREHDGDIDIDTTGGGSNIGQRGIK